MQRGAELLLRHGLAFALTFALSFATEESRGILFYFVGGPGGSGLSAAESYLSAFDPSLIENMDIVFVDDNGVITFVGGFFGPLP